MSNKLKVCLVLTDALSFNALCVGQLEFLSHEKGLDLTMVSGGDDKEIDRLRKRNVGVHKKINMKRKPSIFSDVLSFFSLLFYFSINRFDVVIYSTPKAMLLGGLACFLTFQKKRLCLVRGRAYENFNGFPRLVFRFLDFLIFRVSSRVIFISRSLMEQYHKEKLLKEIPHQLLSSGSSNGIDISKFNVSTHEYLKGGVIKIIIVGRVCKDKGIEDVGKVFSRLSELNIKCRFTLVGNIEDEIAVQVLERMKEIAKNGIVEVFHFNHTYDVVDFFANADVHLFLSHREGFGNVAIEAAACGIPTLAYDVVGVRDSVNDGVSGKLFKKDDHNSIALEIEKIYKRPGNEFNAYSQARAWVVEKFSNRVVWNELFEIIKSDSI